jgi:hypothetical protein
MLFAVMVPTWSAVVVPMSLLARLYLYNFVAGKDAAPEAQLVLFFERARFKAASAR